MRDVEQQREDMRVEPVGDDQFARRKHREPALEPPLGEAPLPRGALRHRIAVEKAAELQRQAQAAHLCGVLFEPVVGGHARTEENTSELQSLMRISYAVFCLKKKK